MQAHMKRYTILMIVLCLCGSPLCAAEDWVDPLVEKLDAMALELEQKLNTETPPKAVFDIRKMARFRMGRRLPPPPFKRQSMSVPKPEAAGSSSRREST